MKIKLWDGMNIPVKDGEPIVGTRGEVYDVPALFGAEQVYQGRAEEYIESVPDPKVDNQDAEKVAKLSTR